MSEQNNHEDLNEDLEHDHDEEHGHDEAHEEPWLVSYADMMTLLFGFFVLMYTFAAAKLDENPDDMVKMRKEVAQYFGGEFVQPLENTAENFKKFLEDVAVDKFVEIKVNPEGLEVDFRSSLLFDSGKSQLKPEAEEMVKKLATLILSEKEFGKRVIVEGHTDDVPIRISKRYSSNWELSGSRAAHVAEAIIGSGFDPQNVKVESYADTKPKKPNRDENNYPIETNRAQNRRVTVKVLSF